MQLKNYKINFHFKPSFLLKNRKLLKSFIAEQLKNAGKSGAEINFIFCSDEELLEINKTYLNHDYYTDIITFDLSESKSSFLISDIYISVDRIKDNAQIVKEPFEKELHRVFFHGLLHLIGYKDNTKAKKLIMRNMEDLWLKEYNK